jgi:RHS repeat-associated protein
MKSSRTPLLVRAHPKPVASASVACVILLLLQAFIPSPASAESGPGWHNAPLKQGSAPAFEKKAGKGTVKQGKASTAQSTPLAQAAAMSAYVAPETAPDFISPEIAVLAGNLQNDPLRILNWVRNNIEFIHYYGCKKGATLTLLEGSGNDADQCALLVALLRAAGHQAKYVQGASYHPYVDAGGVGLRDWLQVEEAILWGFLSSRGTPVGDFGTSGYIINGAPAYGLRRYWVELDGTTPLDPSRKGYAKITGADIVGMSGYSRASLLNAAAGTVSGASVSGLNEAALGTELAARTSALLTAVLAQNPNASPMEIMGGFQLIVQEFTDVSQAYPGSLFSPELVTDSLPDLTSATPPTPFCSTLNLRIGPVATPTMNVTVKTSQLRGRKLTLTFEGTGAVKQATLRLDDADPPLAQEVGGTGTTAGMFMAMSHAGGVGNQADTTTPQTYSRSGSYVLLYGFDISDQWVRARQDKLENYRRTLADTTRQVKTETLNVMGLSWFRQTHLERLIFAAIDNDSNAWAHRFGRMADEYNGTTGGYYVDVAYDFSMLVPRDAVRYPTNGHFDAITAGTIVASAMEHGILEQMQSTSSSPVLAASTVKLLSVGNALPAGQNVTYLADSTNWTAGANIRGQLTQYSANDLATLDARIAGGAKILLPKVGTLAPQPPITGVLTWKGSGYMSVNTSSGLSVGMIIGGTYSGGYAPWTAPASPSPVLSLWDSTPSYVSATSAIVATFGSSEPIDLVTGKYYYDTTDLVLGDGAAPRGLTLARHYSGQTRLTNNANLGYGWNHSLNITAKSRTDTDAALGQTTVQDMASTLVACYAALDVYKNRATVKDWTVAALIANWGVNKMKDNSVALSLADKVVQFHVQPDGTFTPPAGVTMTMTKTAGKYSVQERFGNTYAFDTDGTLLTIKDLWNRTATFTYESPTIGGVVVKRLKTVTDCYGRSFTFNYTGTDLTGVTETAGALTRSVSYLIDANKDLVTSADAEGKNSYFQYNDHRVTKFIDHTNRVIAENFYDSQNRVYQQNAYGDAAKPWYYAYAPGWTVEANPQGGTTSYFFDSRNRLIGVMDALGKKTTTAYDGQDHAVSETTALGFTTSQLYDANQNLTQSVDALGKVTQNFYDGTLHLTQVRDPLNHSTTFGNFNAQHQPQLITDAEGRTLTRTYFAAGNNGAGMVQTTSAAGVLKATFAYDSFGNLNSISYPNGQSESRSYNARGDLISSTNGRGFTATMGYNARRELTSTTAPGSLSTDPNVVSQRQYDDNRNLFRVINPRGFAATMTYSAQGKPLTTALPLGQTMVNHYDSRDWMDSTTDPLLRTVTFTYDAAGQRTKVKDPLNLESGVTYDDDGRPLVATNPLGFTTTSTLDARGALLTSKDAENRTANRVYDDAGRNTQLINRNGQTWNFGYDNSNKPTTTTSPLGRVIQQHYDTQARLWKVTQPSTKRVEFAFDLRDRVTTKSYYNAAGTPTATVNFAPDANGNILTITELAFVLTRTYDQQDRVKSYQNAAGETIGYRYDANGNLVLLTYPDGKTVAYGYDEYDRVVTITDWAGRFTQFSWDYVGRLEKITRANGTWRKMFYDNDDRLTRAEEHLANGSLVTVQQYGFDGASRLTKKFTAPKMHPASFTTFSGTYDADNRLNGFTHDTDGNLLAMPGVPEGNAASAPGALSASWNVRNRLIALTGAAGWRPAFSATYGYDSEGNRISKTVNGLTTNWTVNPHGVGGLSQVLVETAPGGAKKFFVYGPTGLLYDVDATPNVRHFHTDQVGSTVALTNQAGAVIGRAEYSAYGMVSYREGDTNTPFLYNGAYGVMTDVESGLLNMRARYYHPWIGRFASPDPSGFSGGMNWFAYADGNPISATDPFGLDPGGNLNTTQSLSQSAQRWINAYQFADMTLSQNYKTALGDADNDHVNAFQVFHQFVNGTGPSSRTFTENSVMGQNLLRTEHVQNAIYDAIAKSYNYDYSETRFTRSLKKENKVWYPFDFAIDLVTNPTRALHGSIAGKVTVVDLNNTGSSKTLQITIQSQDDLSASSATRSAPSNDRYGEHALEDNPFGPNGPFRTIKVKYNITITRRVPFQRVVNP